MDTVRPEYYQNQEERDISPKAPFVLGIISLCCAFFCQIAGIIFGIIGLVSADKHRKEKGSLVQAGWVLSLAGLIASIIILGLALMITVLAFAFLRGF